MTETLSPLHPDHWYRAGRGPRYQQLFRHLSGLITSGEYAADDQLPSERELADITEVSRVTIRKAIAELVSEGLIEQRHGAGSFVKAQAPRLRQSLSRLVSFTENMQARGYASTSLVLRNGLFRPTPQETVALGLSSHNQVARIHRLRSADGIPMALEYSSLPDDILPEPEIVETSLYQVLQDRGVAPSRAIQRVSAAIATPNVAELLQLAAGSAVLQIERTAYLGSGRPIEFTSGYYHSEMYDFVSELKIEQA